MKFQISRVDSERRGELPVKKAIALLNTMTQYSPESIYHVEIDTLEDLLAISKETRQDLIITRPCGGDKMWGWIKKGVPVRIEVGPRDIAGDKFHRRDAAL